MIPKEQIRELDEQQRALKLGYRQMLKEAIRKFTPIAPMREYINKSFEVRTDIKRYLRKLAVKCERCNDTQLQETEVAIHGGIFVTRTIPCVCTHLGWAMKRKSIDFFIQRHGFDPREIDSEDIKVPREEWTQMLVTPAQIGTHDLPLRNRLHRLTKKHSRLYKQ